MLLMIVVAQAVASNFNIHVKTLGKDVAASPAPGSETGTTYTLAAGTYTVSEDLLLDILQVIVEIVILKVILL